MLNSMYQWGFVHMIKVGKWLRWDSLEWSKKKHNIGDD